MVFRLVGWLGPALLLLCAVSVLEAGQVAVRFPEGLTHGFLGVRAASGELLAEGELLQVLQGERVDSRLIFRFADGSLHDEKVIFSQRQVFALLEYHLVQRGRSFPEAVELSMRRDQETYTLRSRQPDGSEQTHSGRLALPPDVYNGMFIALLKNLPPGQVETVHMVAFTPKPRLLRVPLTAEGQRSVLAGGVARQATRHVLKPEIGGLLGVVASLVGKKPPDLHYWILPGEAPAFLGFEGPFYLGGPRWRVELATPRWPKEGAGVGGIREGAPLPARSERRP